MRRCVGWGWCNIGSWCCPSVEAEWRGLGVLWYRTNCTRPLLSGLGFGLVGRSVMAEVRPLSDRFIVNCGVVCIASLKWLVLFLGLGGQVARLSNLEGAPVPVARHADCYFGLSLARCSWACLRRTGGDWAHRHSLAPLCSPLAGAGGVAAVPAAPYLEVAVAVSA